MWHDNFQKGINPKWQIGEIGEGRVIHQAHALHLTLPPTDEDTYSDAQITDYIPQQRNFTLTAPLRLTVTAYSTQPANQMVGTAGFGFWNHPFVPNEKGFRVPQALWFFFGAPPNDMPLAKGVRGNGWKAATFNAHRWQFYALLPTAPIAIPLMHIPPAYDVLWTIGQRAIGVTETLLAPDLLQSAHTYMLEWHPDHVIFAVDGDTVQIARHGISKNPLGFIAWIDNQYAIVSPKGRFGFGISRVPQSQSLILNDIKIEKL
ncbi:MAG: family 16 glycosylhydrolase [Anaerolineae bacterium]|nr:family 16 glycosylhydrolase [Anaerolineae bacterium]MDQ7033791.1 family 16 glycosylhydrolase [Anaerolineae bacterium]